MFQKAFLSILQKKTYMHKHIDDDIIEEVRLYTLSSLSPHRFDHSVRVAQTAALLCKQYGEDEKLGFFAGLSHDMCKEMDKNLLIDIALEDGDKLSETEIKKPSILHGRVCEKILRKRFHINDVRVLEAVAYHTFGKKNMCNIAKIVCIADKIEPGRPYMSSSKMKNLLKLSLDELLVNVLKEIISVRRKKKDEVFPEALWVLDKNL